MRDLKARDVMTKDVIWVGDNTTASEAARILIDNMITGAPVVDEEGALVGVISLRDIARGGKKTSRLTPMGEEEQAVFYSESWEIPVTRYEVERFHVETEDDLVVRELMTPTLFYVDINAPISEIAEMMTKGRIHRVVVLEEDELAGMVTTMDMMKALTSVHA